jgi:glycosyltransferase involved in cell wall biosynthesis
MACAIQALLVHDEERRRAGERARSFAVAEFSAPRIAARYLKMLEAQDEPETLHYGTSG